MKVLRRGSLHMSLHAQERIVAHEPACSGEDRCSLYDAIWGYNVCQGKHTQTNLPPPPPRRQPIILTTLAARSEQYLSPLRFPKEQSFHTKLQVQVMKARIMNAAA
eukprot:354583-Chlamydomonas_euryale.AAC.3